MSLKIRDAKLGRQEVPESSMIAKSLKKPWDYLPPDFLMERKISPWEYLLPLVANVLFFSTSGPQQHSTFLRQSMALWLEMMCDRSACFVFSDWLQPLFPTAVIMGTCTFAELPRFKRPGMISQCLKKVSCCGQLPEPSADFACVRNKLLLYKATDEQLLLHYNNRHNLYSFSHLYFVFWYAPACSWKYPNWYNIYNNMTCRQLLL